MKEIRDAKKMKIVLVVPGSGGTFYCENCLRDAALVRALRGMGHDVVVAPMYLPLYTDGPLMSDDSPVFFGGINTYLQQTMNWERWAPAWLRRMMDSKWMLSWAARKSGSTRARGLGKMTLAMLEGEAGRHAAELERLVEWIAKSERPDVIQVSTLLLAGLVRRLKAAAKCPVVCLAQDEDTWLDDLEPPYDERCWAAIRERCREVDAVVASSRYYAGKVERRLGMSEGSVEVVYPGIEGENRLQTTDNRLREGGVTSKGAKRERTIGYLSRVKVSLGFGTLVDAFLLLKQRPGFEDVRLRAMGGMVGDDQRKAMKELRRVEAAGWRDDVDVLSEVDRDSRLEFLKTLTVMSVPMPEGPAFGMFLVEAMAAGVPVVQPAIGAFREIVEATGGGVLYEPNTAEALADAWAKLLSEPERVKELGRQGQAAVGERFGIGRMAAEMARIYGRVGKGREGRSQKSGWGGEEGGMVDGDVTGEGREKTFLTKNEG
jgi:glycosyltransferase involved in cell wall biosynthesis